MNARNALSRRIRLLRATTVLVGGLSGVIWGAVALIALLLAAVWLDLLWELTPRWREMAIASATALGCLVVAALVGFWFHRSRHTALVRKLDTTGSTGGQIAAGYELSRRYAADASAPQLTAGLAELAADRAATLASAIPVARVVPARSLRAPGALLSAIAVGLVLVAIFAPRLRETEWLRFTEPYGDHPPYSRNQFTLAPGDASVLYGGGFDVTVTVDGPPVAQVDLVLCDADNKSEESLAMFPEADGSWRATLTGITEPGRYFARAGRARSHRYALKVINVPRLENVRLRVTPPSYTRRPAYEGPLPQGGLSGLVGTQVQVWAESNRPLAGGELTIQCGQTSRVALEPVSSGGKEVTGTFSLTSAGRFELDVTDVTGLRSTEKFSGAIAIVQDQRPFVRIMQPAAVSLATPEATLPVALSGEDDYGISRIQLYRSLNDSRALPMDFGIAQPPPTHENPNQALPLSAYGLAAGDVIRLYARIEDNDPAGAKGSESPLAEVRIISQEDYQRLLLAREGMEVLLSKYRQADRRLAALAERREGLRKRMKDGQPGKLSDADREELRQLAKQLNEDAEANRRALEHLLPYDLDAKLSERLRRLAKALESEAKAAGDLSDEVNLTREDLLKLLDEMEARLADERREFAKEAIEPLEQLEMVFPLIEDQERFVALYKRQRDLAARLASLKGRDSVDDPLAKGRMRDFEAEQQGLRAQLAQLLDDIESHANRLPDDEKLDDLRASALKFADAVRASGASEAMSEAEAGLVEFSGTRGYEGALKAADILEQFISQCQGVAQQGRMCLKFQPQLGEGLGNTVEQLLREMGLGTGDGPGDGSGGGYSARRSTLANVGLYGRLPGMQESEGRKSGQSASGGAGRGGQAGTTAGDAQTVSGELPIALRASGGTDATVPVPYRRRVGAYFQRIAEEGRSR